MILDWAIESQVGQMAAIRLVNVILNISLCDAQYPTQETLSEMPFGFWYIFQDDIIACEPQQFQICAAVFGPVYLKLVEGMLKKCTYRVNDSTWTVDQKELFRCYRKWIFISKIFDFYYLIICIPPWPKRNLRLAQEDKFPLESKF